VSACRHKGHPAKALQERSSTTNGVDVRLVTFHAARGKTFIRHIPFAFSLMGSPLPDDIDD
jgi:hypothetical protein